MEQSSRISPVSEKLTHHHGFDEGAEAVFFLGEISDDLLHDSFIEGTYAATAGVSEEAVGEHFREEVFALNEDLFQTGYVVELLAAGEFAFGVDLGFFDAVSPVADGVEVFEGKAEWVDLLMAAVAVGGFAVLTEQLADGLGSAHIGIDGGHVVRWWRRRCAEDVFEQENTAGDRRSIDTVGGDGEHGTHAEQAAAFVVFEADFAELVGAGRLA